MRVEYPPLVRAVGTLAEIDVDGVGAVTLRFALGRRRADVVLDRAEAQVLADGILRALGAPGARAAVETPAVPARIVLPRR